MMGYINGNEVEVKFVDEYVSEEVEVNGILYTAEAEVNDDLDYDELEEVSKENNDKLILPVDGEGRYTILVRN